MFLLCSRFCSQNNRMIGTPPLFGDGSGMAAFPFIILQLDEQHWTVSLAAGCSLHACFLRHSPQRHPSR